MKLRELDRRLRKAGWRQIRRRGKGSHRAYDHPERDGIVIVPWHQGKDIKPGILGKLLKQAQIEDDEI